MHQGDFMLATTSKLSAYTFVFMLAYLATQFSTTVTANEYTQVEESALSEAELAQLLAPIALYPDTLLTHILIASTYPIEVIESERWLQNKSALSAAQIAKKAEHKDWDASVKALLPFPRVMSQLSEELSWMQRLGDAFLQDEARVMASIQNLRRQAEQAGSLAKMDNVDVIKEQQVIIIEPAQPEVIYVPYYDTRVVYGHWHWSYYPPVYWHRPHHYTAHYGHFYWGHGVHISSHFFFSAFHWHNRHVVVSHYKGRGYHSRKKIVKSHHAKRWYHQPKHRRGVAYSSGRLNKKYVSSYPVSHRNKVVKHHKNSVVVKKRVNTVKVKSNKQHQAKLNKVKSNHVKANQAKSKPVKSKLVKSAKNQGQKPYINSSKKHGNVSARNQGSMHKHAVYKPSVKQPVKSNKSRQPKKYLVKASSHKSSHSKSKHHVKTRQR